MTPFTIVTVLHDSEAPLAALLDSIDRHLADRPQIVAVDTASGDGGARLAAERGVEVLQLGANPGFGAASNAGLERARHPVTVLLNPDCELVDGSLARLAALAAEHEALLVPRLLDADGSIQRSAHPLPGTLGALLTAPLPWGLLPRAMRERVEPWRRDRAHSVGWAIAACLAARTQTLRALGPFDPSAFLFFEDMDLCLRARAAGVPTVHVPDLRIRHLGGHATRPAYAGEPHALLAARRREVVRATRGPVAQRIDGAAQTLTFASRVLGHGGRERERAQLRAQLSVRRTR